MHKVKIKKLREFITFLKTLKVQQFHMMGVSEGKYGVRASAIHWTAEVFPEEVVWVETQGGLKGVRLTSEGHPEVYPTSYVANHLFGMSKLVAEGLFSPEGQQEVHPNLVNLSEYASPYMLADVLVDFTLIVEEGRLEDHIAV